MLRTAIGLKWKTAVLRQPATVVGPWLRAQLGAMGPLGVKVGQWASNRPDLFDDYASELAGLRDECAYMDAVDVDDELRRIFGGDRSVLAVCETPIASASMGQVHRGVRFDTGETVAVKIKRPGVERSLRRSVVAAGMLTKLLVAMRVPGAADVQSMVLDLLETFAREADFLDEAAAMAAFSGAAGVVVPRPHLDLCSRDVLVMDYLPSVRVTAVTSVKARRRLARKLMTVFMRQLLDGDVLHADPHPGNYGVLPDGRLALYDFGNVLPLTDDLRFHVKHFALKMALGDVDGAIDILQRDLNLRVLDASSLADWLAAYYAYLQTPGLDLTTVAVDLRTQPVVLTPDLLKIMRAFSSLEGVCVELDPEFQYFKLVAVFLESLFDQEFMERKASVDWSN